MDDLELPTWVWPVVAALQYHEDTHNMIGTAESAVCWGDVLAVVPDEVRSLLKVLQAHGHYNVRPKTGKDEDE